MEYQDHQGIGGGGNSLDLNQWRDIGPAVMTKHQAASVRMEPREDANLQIFYLSGTRKFSF
jgi:hypothetical protein